MKTFPYKLHRQRLLILLCITLLPVLLGYGCNSSPVSTTNRVVSTPETTVNNSTTGLKTFTVAELSAYDGQKGNPAYIAVDGKVYDVTNVSEWSGGMHIKYIAGKDYTAEMKNKSPHGVAVMNGVPIVGTLLP